MTFRSFETGFLCELAIYTYNLLTFLGVGAPKKEYIGGANLNITLSVAQSIVCLQAVKYYIDSYACCVLDPGIFFSVG